MAHDRARLPSVSHLSYCILLLLSPSLGQHQEIGFKKIRLDKVLKYIKYLYLIYTILAYQMIMKCKGR